ASGSIFSLTGLIGSAGRAERGASLGLMHLRNSCVLGTISFPLTDLEPGLRKRNTPALENIQMLVESAPRTPFGT
ncbi:MAG: hypothetical protein ACM34G_03200, partial [Acidobacteriota bacterium]